MIRCEICGSLMPDESQKCSKCGSPVKPKEKHFSLEDIANQQLKQNNEIGVGADTPDDDPGGYLPPIGFSDQMQFSGGSLVIEESHTPLPNIESDDPLELLESGSEPLPPIGFSDQMELKDLNMRHYKGGGICPEGLQLQIYFSVSENTDIIPILTSAQAVRNRMFEQQQAEQISKVSLKKDEPPVEPAYQETESPKPVSLEKNIPQSVSYSEPVHQETVSEKTVSLEKNPLPSTPVSETANEYGQTYDFELQKSDYGTSEYQTETIPSQTDSFHNEPEQHNQPIQPQNTYPNLGAVQPETNFNPQNSMPPQTPNTYPSFGAVQPENNFSQQNSIPPQTPNAYPSFGVAQPENNFSQQNSIPPQTPNAYPSFGAAQPENNFSQQNSIPPQTPNAYPSFGAVQPENNFSQQNFAATQTPNAYPSFGAVQPQNNFNNSNFGAVPQNNYNAMNQAAALARGNNNAKILSMVAVVLIIGAILAILAMIVTGHYRFDDASQRLYSGTSAEGTVISSEVNIRDIRWSNLNNGGLAAEDDEGNIYYSNSTGCLCKLDTNGQKTVIYNAAATSNYILYINCYEDRIYFLASLTGTSYTMCSVNQDGKDFTTYSAAKKPYTLFVEDGYLYYIDETESNLYRTDIATDESELVLSVPNQSIHSMFVNDGKIYVQHMPETYDGQIDVIDESDIQNVTTLSLNDSGKTLTPALSTYYGGRIYFVDGKDYILNQMYSCNPDGTDVKRIGGKNVATISVYGEYIYYLYVSGTLPTTQYSADGYNSYIYTLGRIRTDGSDNRQVAESDILYYSIVGDRIYYVNYSGEMTTMKLDGTDIQKV